jgi:hypothetical protein
MKWNGGKLTEQSTQAALKGAVHDSPRSWLNTYGKYGRNHSERGLTYFILTATLGYGDCYHHCHLSEETEARGDKTTT